MRKIAQLTLCPILRGSEANLFSSPHLACVARRVPGARNRSPSPKPLRRSRRRSSHATAAMTRGRAGRARQDLLHRLPQRSQQGRRADAGGMGRDARVGAARDHREDDPQAARRHDAAERRPASRAGAARRSWSPALESRMDALAVADPESGLASVPAPESRRVRARDPAACSISTSTSPRSCPPTPSATASTTSPTCRRSRRR